MGIKLQSKKRIYALRGKSLIDTNPELCMEWDYSKNVDLIPETVSKGSRKKVWWKCEKGHEWLAMIVNRINGRDCPYCNNKKVLQGYNDLTTTRTDLAKEWNYEKNYPLTPQMLTQGCAKKVWWRCDKGHEWQSKIESRKTGHNCPYCSGRFVIQGKTDLATTRPDLVKEWNYEKNGTLMPQMVATNSNKKVWWKCEKEHEWKVSISNRSKGRGCPYCSNHNTYTGYNDLATTNPELVKEWNYEKNGQLTPQMVSKGSKKKVW